MASFSVDITEVKFAATNIGYKDITITGMPQAGVNCTITGTDASSFGYRIPGSDQNVYRVYTTGNTSIGTSSNEKTATFKITNLSDSTDYVEVSLLQAWYLGKPVVRGVENVYDNIYAYYAGDASASANLFAEYRTDNVGTYVILYVDGYEGTTTLSESWAYYTADSAYSDTGFKRIMIGAANNYDTAFRYCTITFPGSGGTHNQSTLYQNAYPSSTSGCTSPTLYTKDGGTERVTLSHSSQNVSNLSARKYYTNDGLTYSIKKTAASDYKTYWDVTIGPNSSDKILRGALLFERTATHTLFGFTIVRQDPSSGPVPTLTATPPTLSYPASGGGRTLDVTYATSLSTNESSFPSWLGATYVSTGQGSGSYTITAASNTSTSSRSFNFNLADANMSLAVPITQDAGSSSSSISVSPSSLSFGPDASYADISLTYGGTYFNTDAQEVYTWVTVNMSDTKTGKAAGTVSVASNTTTESRRGNVYFSDELGASIALPIEQAGISFALSANPSTLNIPARGGSVTTAVTYEGTLSAASLPSWLSETHTDNDANHRTYTVTAASNGPTQERTFNWRLDDDYNNMYVFISQPAAKVPSMVISPTSQSVGEAAGTVEITVRSTNISDIIYNISGDWIKYKSKSGSVYTFSYYQNDTMSVRQGSITFSGGGISRTFKLTQREGEVSLVISPTSSSVGSSAGTVEITVSSSGISEISYNISGDWITYSSKSGDVYTFNYTENTTTSQRQGSITFSGGGISETFTLTQEGISSDAISVDKEIVCIPNNGGGGFTVTITYNGNVTVSKPSWVLNNTTSMTVNGKYKYTFSANARNEDGGKEPMRTDSLVFIGDNGTRTKVLICQGGYTYGRVPVIYPTKLNEFSADGGSQYLVVDYYKTLTISKGINWITVNRDESYNNDYSPSVYVVTAMRNIHSRRAGTFTLQGETGSYKIVDVSQAESSASSISVSPTELNYTAAGGTKSVTVSGGNGTINVNNGSFPSWLSIKSAGGGVYNLTTTKNTGKARSFTVWFTDNTSTVTMNVYQQAGDTPGPGPTPVVTGSLKAYPKKLRYYSEGGGMFVSFTNRPTAGIGYTITYTDGSGWLSVKNASPDMYVSATANSGIRRRAEIRFYDLNDSTNYVIVPVIQGSVNYYNSIWMDDLYYPKDRDSSGNYFYRVDNQNSGYTYFTGVSSKPLSWSGDIGGIDVPRLVDNYIGSGYEYQRDGEDWANMYLGCSTVDIYNMTENGYPGVVDATFKYWNDWSRFERRYDYTRSLNDPINCKGCNNMIIPFCVYYDDAATFSVVDTEKNGNVNTYTFSAPSTKRSPFAMRRDSYYDSVRIDYKQDNDVIFSYDMTHCGPGAFIYRNRFGGWDSFLIEGNISKTDNYTKQNYRIKGEYDQEYSIDAYKYIDEKRTASIDIDTTYEAYTGWLTDEESERLAFHLLSSPIVYFQNLHKENQVFDTDPKFGMMPIRITASSAEYKKFRNGKRLVNYLITFEKCNIEKVRQ